MAKELWNSVPQTPLNTLLDTRSIPPSTAPGVFRWKLNMGINSTGNLCRRDGHAALNLGSGLNWDHHRRGATREAISFLYENTSPAGVRQLFDGSETKVSVLDNETGEWSDILTGMSGGNWKAAGLRSKVVLTNNVDLVQMYDIDDESVGPIAELASLSELDGGPITKAKVAISYAGVVMLMNVEAEVDGDPTRLSNRIIWSDYRDASVWTPGDPSIAGFQDLDEGEIILNAIIYAGMLYVFTDRAIWKGAPAGGEEGTTFGFTRWYSDPKNRTGCLFYENALASTGKELIWAGAETLYWCNQFSAAPTSPEWLLRGSGTMYVGDDRIDDSFCQAPVAHAMSFHEGASREVWFSYPRKSTGSGLNDYSLVLSFNIDSTLAPYQTCDYVDHGYTAMTSFSKTIEEGGECRFVPARIAASSEDWCLKSIGGVKYREMVSVINLESDIPDAAYALVRRGYKSIVRGLCPFGNFHVDKRLRRLLVEHETADALAHLRLRIGNSFTMQDTNEDEGRCRVLWHEIDRLPLACPTPDTVATMLAQNIRPDSATEFPMLEQGRYLYFELTIEDAAGDPVVGGESAWAGLRWEVMSL